MRIPTLLAALAVLITATAAAAEPPASPSVTPIKHSLKACNKQADTKKLTGAARAQFVKACQAPRTS
jgi:psiF repeat